MRLEVEREIAHAHLFCGIGGGAIGFNRGHARVGNVRAKFVCAGGIDVDPASCRDFGRRLGVPATCLDLFTVEQYQQFHGAMPPPGWRQATPDDVRRAFSRRPNIVFLSAPCKGFSGLLSEAASLSTKYQALNGLTLRGVWLTLEAYKDDPVELIVFENVPRIMTRGRQLLDRINALLDAYGYAHAETTHDCGELGDLAQSRKRFLLVARHKAKVPPFLYEPDKHRLRGVGEVLERLPMPLSGAGGPMHRMPSLQWKTWVRLAFVRAGADWRSLNELAVDGGFLRDYGIVPGADRRGPYGVTAWDEPAGVVTSNGRPGSGKFSVADPRLAGKPKFNSTFRIVRWGEASPAVAGPGGPAGGLAVADPRGLGDDTRKHVMRVTDWDEHAGAITSGHSPSNGAGSVADPRVKGRARSTQLGVKTWEQPAGVVAGESMPTNGAFAVADPRPPQDGAYAKTKYRVTPFDEASRTFAVADPRPTHGPNAHTSKHRVSEWTQPSGAVTGSDRVGSGAPCVADPIDKRAADRYGVVRFDEPARAVTGHGQHDNGYNSVADERASRFASSNEDEKSNATLPNPTDRLVAIIFALDGTWHRPFTTLELAALQGLVDPEEQFELDGLSDAAWRERIGNCVPPPSAQAIAGIMGETLLLAWSGATFTLGSTPIWVRNVAIGLSVDGSHQLPEGILDEH